MHELRQYELDIVMTTVVLAMYFLLGAFLHEYPKPIHTCYEFLVVKLIL